MITLKPDPQHECLVAVVGTRYHPVRCWRDVSEAYRRTIDALDIGASHAPRCDILDSTGQIVAHVSYNGRIWSGSVQDFDPDARPLYEPLPLN
jgi:hypothetical protein